MSHQDYNRLENIRIRLVIENAELQRKVNSLEQYKQKHACPDCDNPMGLGIAERKKCDYCEKEFCSLYSKGEYVYASVKEEPISKVKYQCHLCKEKNLDDVFGKN